MNQTANKPLNPMVSKVLAGVGRVMNAEASNEAPVAPMQPEMEVAAAQPAEAPKSEEQRTQRAAGRKQKPDNTIEASVVVELNEGVVSTTSRMPGMLHANLTLEVMKNKMQKRGLQSLNEVLIEGAKMWLEKNRAA